MDEIEWAIIAYLMVETVGLAMAGRAIMTTRTSQGAIAWATSLVAFPLLTLPLYLVFGRRKFERSIAARRADIAAIQPVLGELERRAPSSSETESQIDSGRLKPLERLAKFPFIGGNDAQLLIDGEATFKAIFSEIEAAREYILVQYYLLRDDHIGRELQRRLIAKLG